ncbi:MAG TPA: MMPL family transporter [Acidimicrobiales bacterium]|nr:MMPL family transporter [Acidimicrobiales bacterium]
MRRTWAWMGLNFGKHAGIVGVAGLAVTLVLGLGITRLEFATGQDSYLNKDEQVYKDSVAYQGLFGGQAMLTLFTMDDGATVADLFTPENIAHLEQVDADLRATDGVLTVVSPLTALEFTQNLVTGPPDAPEDVTRSVAGQALLGARDREPDPEAQAIRLDDAATTLARIGAVTGPHDIGNPEWVDFLLFDNRGEIRKSLRPFFPDEAHAQIVTRLVGNESLEDEGAASERIQRIAQAEPFDGAATTTTGASVLLKDLNDYLRGGMLTLGAIAVAIMVVILVLLFRVRWRLLPLLVILVGVTWAFGLAGYLGIPLSVVTIAGLPVMLGVGIDYAIQMHSRIEEEVVVDRAAHPIQEASVNLGPALLVVTFDAVFAFLALRFARVPMIREFGSLLAVGIAAICVGSIVLPLAILGIREYRSPTKARDYSHGNLARIVVWLGSLPARAAVPLAVLSVVTFVGGIAVEDQLDIQSDPEHWVNQDTQVIRDIDTIKRETGSSAELGIFVQSDEVFSDETVAFVSGLAVEELETRPDSLLTASSLPTTMAFVLEMPGTTTLPPTGADVERAYAVAPPDIQRSLVSPDGGALNLVFRTGPGSLEERAVYTDAIRDELDAGETAGGVEVPAGVRATPSGLAVVGVGLLQNIESNRILLTYLAVAFVFAFLTVRLRSVVRALLSMVPVLIAVGAASLVAWVLDLQLSPMTAVGGPLVVALCTEFTSLILLRFIEERHRGHPPREAVDATAARTGRAFIVSALTAVSGVAVIATSSLPLLRDFGTIVAMNVAVALLSALVFLPPMLVWAEERGWVTRGLRPPAGLGHPGAPAPRAPEPEAAGRP